MPSPFSNGWAPYIYIQALVTSKLKAHTTQLSHIYNTAPLLCTNKYTVIVGFNLYMGSLKLFRVYSQNSSMSHAMSCMGEYIASSQLEAQNLHVHCPRHTLCNSTVRRLEFSPKYRLDYTSWELASTTDGEVLNTTWKLIPVSDCLWEARFL